MNEQQHSGHHPNPVAGSGAMPAPVRHAGHWAVPSVPHRGHTAASPATAHDAHGQGREKHAGHSVAMFRDKFWLSLALTIPVVIWSADLQEWLGYEAPEFPGSELIPALLGTLFACRLAR